MVQVTMPHGSLAYSSRPVESRKRSVLESVYLYTFDCDAAAMDDQTLEETRVVVRDSDGNPASVSLDIVWAGIVNYFSTDVGTEESWFIDEAGGLSVDRPTPRQKNRRRDGDGKATRKTQDSATKVRRRVIVCMRHY